MKNKYKLIMFAIILVCVLLIFSKSVMGIELWQLNGSGSSTIGNIVYLSKYDLQGGTDLYCMQHDKGYSTKKVPYVVKEYIYIDGLQAYIYSVANQYEPVVNENPNNAHVAQLLSYREGYGSSPKNTSRAQGALWMIFNSWTNNLFGMSNPYGYNIDYQPKEWDILYHTAAGYYYDQLQQLGNSGNVTVTDNTNKDDLIIIDVDDYYRVGPFNWTFDKALEGITVTGNNGQIADSDVRFIINEGTAEKIVNASEISSGQSFYVDIKSTSGATEIKGLKLKTTKGIAMGVHTAQIWILENASNQNFLYAVPGSRFAESASGEGESEYNIQLKTYINLEKVDDRNTNKKLAGVEFKFKASVYRYIGNQWQWVERYLDSNLKWSIENISQAQSFYTDNNGILKIDGILSERTKNVKAIEASNPNYGYDIGGEYSIKIANENEQIGNHQAKVKLSGYVWLDEVAEKMSVRNDRYDSGSEKGINGITVYLKDLNGNIISKTTTAELELYSEINGGEYQFVDVDLDKVQTDQYYVEFEYCGITYQSVNPQLNQITGSKAVDAASRNLLDSKFTSVDATGTQNITVNGVNINYSNTSNHTSTIVSHTGCNVSAKTNEAGYDLYDSAFVPGQEEIRNVNLGLYVKPQADYALAQDLYNVRVEVNGFSHIYRYAGVRYTNKGNTVNEESSWNVGVKFQNNAGTYSRAIYTADCEYESPNHKDNELKVYLTYKIALKNESTYLARINSIIDYCDNRYELVNVGTQIDDNDNITQEVNARKKQAYNEKYSKYIIDTNIVVKPGETNYVYAQFKMEREAVLTILNNGETLNNVVEINSYTTFKDNNINTPVSAIDVDSVPGNIVPGQINTYEDDTDAAKSLQLELKNERHLEGTVFVDSTGKDSNIIYSGEERLGNGIFDAGEKTLAGIKVKLTETGKEDSSYDGERIEMETVTDENGNFIFKGFIPGNYIVTYTWGDKTYSVQYYKGTIYDANRDQNNKYWYKIDKDIRKTDALDNFAIREKIDNEMKNITTSVLENEINKAYDTGSEIIKTTTMDSSSPVMSVSVEYETVMTDGIGDQVVFTIKNIDFGIVERPKQQIELNKRVSGIKITLANGQVLIDAEVTEDGKLKGLKDNLTYMGPTSSNGIETNGIVKAEMDSELIEGATIETTYVVKAKNTSELDYTSERYYYYADKNNAGLIGISASGVIDYLDSKLSSVSDDNWKEIDQTILDKYGINKKEDERVFVTSKLGQFIKPGEFTNELEFKTSKLLTTSSDNYFNNKAEITEVKKTDAIITGTPVKVTFDEEKYYFDIANSEMVTIIPSTGENRDYVLPITIGISSLLLLGVGVFVIRKYVIK